MSKTQPFVTIKGKKDGLILELDENCAYDRLIHELKDKLVNNQKPYQDGPLISVKVQTGHRYLSQEQKKELTEIIRSQDKLFVASIESDVMTKAECEDRLAKSKMMTMHRMVRSGQILEVEGNLLLFGDVNPGGQVIATGNIYIMGVLRGIAHAGVNSERSAIIAASVMKPTQLRIDDVISRSDDNQEFDKRDHAMEYAFIDSSLNQIVIDRIQSLSKKNFAFMWQ
ncbi:septum site-determining protein MinC [Terrilactibacillus sp. BCM23-1]|uniref:Probable septum site-determining protein MinC n=1 Tax=Terrilactibacillus tamarindi TaxID=2599694 RepID=A0A6N8CNP4_9BACI|nr:septum site-determining protein MinC [Terrilactibacillus tamarindi]MTT31759.1 septum site-determining protein MinC [Terrilactibacillus tamarindi]